MWTWIASRLPTSFGLLGSRPQSPSQSVTKRTHSPRSLIRKSVSFNEAEIMDDSMILATKKLNQHEMDRDGDWVLVGEVRAKSQRVEKSKTKPKKVNGPPLAKVEATKKNGKSPLAQPLMMTRGNKLASASSSVRSYSTRGGGSMDRESTPPILSHRRRTDYRKKI